MSVMKVWNGSSWVKPFFAYPKIWNGSDWVYGIPKIWNAQSSTDSKSVTVGFRDDSIYGEFDMPDFYYGFSKSLSFGSISSNISQLYSGWDGLEITDLYYRETIGGTVVLNITNAPDSNWNTMIINGVSFSRSSASYSSGNWSWGAGSNPFGTSGTITVTWS